MRFVKYLLVLLGVTIALNACNKVNDLGIRPLGEAVSEKIQECDIRSITHSKGIKINIQYEDGRPIRLQGFNDFDDIFYTNGALSGANALATGWEMTIGLNGNDDIEKITLKGRESSGRPSESITTLEYDNKGRIDRISLGLSIFDDSIDLKLDYNGDNNITKVSQKNGSMWRTLLENKKFDDKKSPFTQQRHLGQLLSYFMAYTLVVGEANYTYFLNQNNVTEWVISNEIGKSEVTVNYEYSGDYPTKANMSKTTDGRLSSVTETFAYNCQ